MSSSTTSSEPSVKGKEKASGKRSGFKARLVPGRIATKWGVPPTDIEASGRILLLCSEDVLERARRKFGLDTKHVHVNVCLRKDVDKAEPPDAPEDDNGEKPEKEADEGLECELVRWDEIPDGCVVMTGKIEKGWETWGEVR